MGQVKVRLNLRARHDRLKEFFERSGAAEGIDGAHLPFLTFAVSGNEGVVDVTVQPVREIDALMALPDDTLVMRQWAGKVRSDYFRFTVGQLRAFVVGEPGAEDEPEPMHVVSIEEAPCGN